MRVIHTCQLNGVNALDYLQTLSEHSEKPAAAPQQWLPWTYRDTDAALGPAHTSEYSRRPAQREETVPHAYRRDTSRQRAALESLPGEGATCVRLQVAFEGSRPMLLGEGNHGLEGPRAVRLGGMDGSRKQC